MGYIKQVKNYLDNTGSLDDDFGYFSKVYSMTTENIYGFLKRLDLNNKKVLTVSGSGDQRLNSILLGASEIKCFDSNPLTRFQLEIKDQAIKRLNYEKFIKFFGIYSKKYSNYYKTLDPRLFYEIKNGLSNQAYDFFNYVITNKSSKSIYFDFQNNLEELKEMDLYLRPDKYEELSKKINEHTLDIIDSNIVNLPSKLGEEKYDIILLSNISDYTHKIFDKDELLKYRELIEQLKEHLNLYGMIQVGYIYSEYSKFSDVGDFINERKRREYFPTDEFHTIQVDPYYRDSHKRKDNKKDKVIIYQKLK